MDKPSFNPPMGSKHRAERRKEFEEELRILERELKENQQISEGLDNRRKQIFSKITQVKNSISQLKPPSKLTISDHAVLRYAERFHNVPVEKIRAEIYEALGKCNFQDFDELTANGFVIRNNNVVTYVPNEYFAEKKDV